MSEQTVDTTAQAVPTLTDENGPGSTAEATEALLKLLDGDEPQPEVTEEPTQEAVSEDTPEEESEDTVEDAEEDSDDEYEPEDNKEVEGDDVADVYTVKIDGADSDVTLDELISGYHRQSDYTRKTQELAAERKQVQEMVEKYQTDAGDMDALREQYVQAVGQYIQQTHSNLGEYSKINWKELKQDDPIEYMTKRDEFRELQSRIQHSQAMQKKALDEQGAERDKMMEQHVSKEHEKMIAIVPDWGDAEKRAEIAGKIRGYAGEQGFEEAEVNGLVDHRSLNVLIKAMKYDELQNGQIRDKKVRNKPRLVKSGSVRTKEKVNQKERKAKINRLKASGSAKDAAALLEDLL